MPVSRRLVALLLPCVVLASCSGGAALSPALIAGNYVLTGATSRGGPGNGTMVLRADGSVARHVFYPSVTGVGGTAQDLTGRYHVVGGDVIQLELDEGDHVWTVRATIDDGVLVMTYPDASDGTIREWYQKVTLL